jgi:hypothetical protein
MRRTLRPRSILLAGLLIHGAGAAAVGVAAWAVAATKASEPAAGPVKRWELNAEAPCDWWLSRDDGHSHRASISSGDSDVVLSLSDSAFLPWSDSDRPRVELMFDHDPKRRITVEGWTTHGDNDSVEFGLYLGAEGRHSMGGATWLELRRDGKLVMEQPLAGTPSQAELDACVGPPESESSDVE